MTYRNFTKSGPEKAPENYERYFVPVIGRPLAEDLVGLAGLQSGERVLDVACGTGIVARLAAKKVGSGGYVAGLDANPGMLAVARKLPAGKTSVEWYEANAEAMPLPDDSFDAVFCQMGLQFMDDKVVALKEMRRVLVPGGRLILNLPGPAAKIFSLFEQSLDSHLSSDAAGFLNQVFSLHDRTKIQNLLTGAGFTETDIRSGVKELTLPPAQEFLWQYIYATPLAALVAGAGDESCQMLEKDLENKWQAFRENGSIKDGQPMVTVIARK